MDSQVQLKNGTAFASKGLLQLCNLVSLAELKAFRSVSKGWNDLVSLHPRYREARVQLGPNWFLQSNALQLSHVTPWRHVTLNCFHYAENKTFFSSYWQRAGDKVCHLTLAKVKITCSDFNAFLNTCPSVSTLIIADMEFTPEAIRVDVHHGPQGQQHRVALFCSHTDGNFGAAISEPILPATIQYLRFDTMRYFPHCSLAYLAFRCRGTLEKLVIENTPVLAHPPNIVNLLPSLADIRPRILRLVTENVTTLTSFTFYNNASGQELLQEMANIPELGLHELVLAVYREGQVGNNAPPVQQVEPFLALAEAQRNRGLRCLFLKTHFNPAVQAFLNQYHVGNPGSKKMEKFKMAVDSRVGPHPNLAFLTQLAVKELSLGDATGGDLRFVFGNWHAGNNAQMFPNCQYWTTLPNTLRALTVAHKLQQNDPHILPAITNGGLQLLTKLHVRDGRPFTDTVFQHLIENLVNLTDLTVRRATHATDAAFTGLPVALSNTFRTCESYAVLDEDAGVTIAPAGRSIKELVHLRKLDLSGCSGISDVSCRFGFEFESLTNLDLSECVRITDIGLFWLGRNNPGLKEVQLRKHVNVSHFGVNQFVGQVSVRNISVSRCVLERQMGTASYAQHPLLPEVAHLALPSAALKAQAQRRF